MIERVLVAADNSPESLDAARAAADLAADWGARVRVLTVVEDAGVAEEVAEVAGPGVLDRRELEADRLLSHIRRQVSAGGVPDSSVETVRRSGEPFRQIIEESRQWAADLIVLAVSDRRGVRSPYIGSVTEQVLEFADCPVLVVPGRARR